MKNIFTILLLIIGVNCFCQSYTPDDLIRILDQNNQDHLTRLNINELKVAPILTKPTIATKTDTVIITKTVIDTIFEKCDTSEVIEVEYDFKVLTGASIIKGRYTLNGLLTLVGDPTLKKNDEYYHIDSNGVETLLRFGYQYKPRDKIFYSFTTANRIPVTKTIDIKPGDKFRKK